MAVTDRQRRDFETLGWFHLGRVFDASALEEIRKEYDRILSRPLRIGEDGKAPFDYSPLLHVQSQILCRYATARPLVEAPDRPSHGPFRPERRLRQLRLG